MKHLKLIFRNGKSLRVNILLVLSLLVLAGVVSASISPSLPAVLGGAKENLPIDENLVLYIGADSVNETHFLDESGNGNDGLKVGNVNRTHGKVGYGIRIVANDNENTFVNLTTISNIDQTTTIEGWFLTHDAQKAQTIFTQVLGNTNITLINIQVGQLRVGFYNGAWTEARSSTTLSNDVWHYFSYSFNTTDGSSTNAELFLDGINQTGSTAPSGVTNLGTRIGARTDTSMRFNGTIDELKVRTNVLTHSQKFIEYQRGLGNGSITTSNPLAASINTSNRTDVEGDPTVLKVEWWKNNNLTAVSGYCLNHTYAVGCYTFDSENMTGVYEDFSGKNNDLTVGASTQKFTNNSIVGFGAVEFFGTSASRLGGNIDIRNWTNITVGAWVRFNSFVANGGIVSWRSTTTALYTSGGGTVVFSLTNESDLTPVASVSENGLLTNTKYLFVGTYNGSDVVLYNGCSKIGSSTGIKGGIDYSTYGTPAAGLWIGETKGGSEADSNAIVDNVFILNWTESQEEICAMYLGERDNGLILNASETRKGDIFNVTVTNFDNESLSSTPVNFTFPAIGNTAPNQTQFINATGLIRKENMTLAWGECSDIDEDLCRPYLFCDENNPPTTLLYNGEVSTAEEGLVAAWHMNGANASNIPDATGVNNGTSNGGLTCGVEGRLGEACSFDGKDDGVAINVGNLSGNISDMVANGFWISAWIKADSRGEVGVGYIISKDNGQNSQEGFRYNMNADGLLFAINSGGNRITPTDAIGVGDGNWYHVLVTVDSNALVTHYINGVQSGTPGTTGALSGITTLNDACIGNRAGTTSCNTDRTFNGSIDELSFGLGVPSADEVYQKYNLSIHRLNQTSDGTLFCQVKWSDNTGNSSLSNILNFTLDTSLITDFTNLTNNTFTNKNLTIELGMEHIYPLNISAKLYKGSNTYHLNSSTNAIGRFLNMTINFNVTEDGNYTLEINESTRYSYSPKIKEKIDLGKDGETHFSFNETGKAGINMDMSFRDDVKNTAPTADIKSFTKWNKAGTRAGYGSNFTVGKAKTRIVYDFKADSRIYIHNDTGIKGHITWGGYGNDNKGIVKVNGIEVEYTVEIGRISDYNVQVEIIPKADLQVGDFVETEFESIFGLHQNDVFYTLVIDRTSPTATLLNRTALGDSTEITNLTNVNLTLQNVADMYPDWINISHNASGTWVNHSITVAGNASYSLTVSYANLSDGEHIGWIGYVFDKAGNLFTQEASFVVLGVEGIPPPVTDTGSGAAGIVSGLGEEKKTADEQQQIDEQVQLALCSPDLPFIDRLFSKCKIEGNGICDDGENVGTDEDCKLTAELVSSGEIFTQMWFLRFMILLAIFLLFIKSDKFSLAVIVVIALLTYNGAFTSPLGAEEQPTLAPEQAALVKEAMCMDVNYFIHLGDCLQPENPMLGWGLAALAGFAVYKIFSNRKKKKDRRRSFSP